MVKSYLCGVIQGEYFKPEVLLTITLVFFVAAGIQLIYLIIFLIALNRKRTETSSPPVPVSVIVCAHDEEVNLRELIPLLEAQNYPSFEIIIVNDRSNDGTYDFLLEETKRNSRIKAVTVDRAPAHVNGKKFGITLGIRAAVHEWILLTDADCRPAGTTWIASMSKQFDDQTQIVLGFSPYSKTKGFLNLFIRFEALVTALQYFSYALLKNPYMGVGRNLSYRKSLFLEKKGFNQFLNVTGGDDDLFVNQHAHGTNTKIEFGPEAHVYSSAKTSWRSFFYQKIRHLAVGKRYQLKHRIQLGVFALSWILTWFVGVPLLIIDFTNLAVPVVFGIRLIILLFAVKTMVKQSRTAFELWSVPLLDFVYSIYYISTGLVALFTKKVRWRK